MALVDPRSRVRFDTIKQPKAAQLVAERIRTAMRSGELRDGDRLPPERALIEQFGYSRAIIREALRLLEEEGLISLRAGRNGGAMIRTPGPEQLVAGFDMLLRLRMTTIEDLYEARRLLEPLLIGLAIERATDEDIAGLRRCLEPPESPRDASSFRPQNNRFHRLLSEAAHNNVLALVTNMIMELSLKLMGTSETEPSHRIEEHRLIIEAMEARDVTAASERIIQHLNHSEKRALAGPRWGEPSVLATRAKEPAPRLRRSDVH